MELVENKKFLHSKGNHHQTEETAYRMEGKSFPAMYLKRD
jgi:hypothetical protein